MVLLSKLELVISYLTGPISATQICGIEKDKYESCLSDVVIVRTGTLTDAKPIYSGESWVAIFEGILKCILKVKLF